MSDAGAENTALGQGMSDTACLTSSLGMSVQLAQGSHLEYEDLDHSPSSPS